MPSSLRVECPDLPLGRLLSLSASRFGGKPAVVYGTQVLSYSDLDSLCIQFSKSLRGLGVKKGSCVALYMPNTPQFVTAFFGALKAGAAVTAINPLHREREVQFQLNDSEAHTIIADCSLRGVVEAVKAQTNLRNMVYASVGATGFDGLPPSVERQADSEALPSDLAVLQYTGGTTGEAKAAMLTHRNLACNAQQFAAAICAQTTDVFLAALPLSHIYGLTTSLTAPLSVGAAVVLLPRFNAETALQTIRQQKVSVFCGVPSMYQMLLSAPQLAAKDLASLRVCISGAASLPLSVQRRFMEASGGLLAEGYGLTEASPVTHCSPVDGSLRMGSVGLPLALTEAKIVDLEDGVTVLGVGEVGELAVRGPQVMAGYWKRLDETADVLRDGWLFTGDVASIDADGYLTIVDRKKDLIKHHGYSIYPRELEEIIYLHPAVKQCAVVGKSDAASGEVPVAFVVAKADGVVSERELLGFVNGKVASYKALQSVTFRVDLPVSPAGKILKRCLEQ